MSRTILVMAAGSGGHIYPGLAIADELAARGWTVHWMGTPAGMENRLVKQAGYPIVTVKISGVRGKGALTKLVQPWVQLKALLGALRVIFKYRPDVAIGFGGFTGFPGGLAMRLLWLPLVLAALLIIYLPGFGNRLVFDDEYLATGRLFMDYATLAEVRTRMLAYGFTSALKSTTLIPERVTWPVLATSYSQRTGAPTEIVGPGGWTTSWPLVSLRSVSAEEPPPV